MSPTMADLQVKAKVTRMDFTRPSSRGPPTSRPSSPSKSRATSQVTSAAVQPIRPKAKVSSSAQVGSARKPPTNSAPTKPTSVAMARHTAGTTFRSPSPLKQLEPRSGRASPAFLPGSRTKADTKSLISVSVPSSPRTTRPPSMVRSGPPDSTLSADKSSRPRVASVSSTSQVSTSSMHNQRSNGLLAPTPAQDGVSSDGDTSSNVSVRITSKVSGIVKRKSSASSSPLQSPLPSTPSTPLPNTSKPPSPVIARLTTTPPSPGESQFYPITTATPAANAHRFSVSRRISSSFSRSPLPHTVVKSTDLPMNVDPAMIPLPPLSPPSSTVSYSSQSSASRPTFPKSSFSGDAITSFKLNSVHGHVRTFSHDSAVRDGLGLMNRIRSAAELRGRDNIRPSSVIGGGSAEEDLKVRAEAKSIRKIADLEITNKSLLAINATLEETRHRQAREIRELRRKLRESRLVLPPPTFKQLQSGEASSEPEEEDDDDDDSDSQDIGFSKHLHHRSKEEETFDRIRIMLENLLESGRRALESSIADHADLHTGTKVLHETEARTWRDGGYSKNADMAEISVNIDEASTTVDTEDERDVEDDNECLLLSALRSGNNSMRSEDEVEDMMQSFYDDGNEPSG